MMTKQAVSLALAIICSVALTAPAMGGITPAQKCASAKMKAVGKKQAAKAKCYAKALSASVAVVPACLELAEGKFVEAFTKAEAGDACLHMNDAAAIEAKIDAAINDILGDLGCGNGLQEGDELCDDNNVVDGDGCNSTCTVESGFECAGTPSVCTPTATCGNGVIDGAEECDDSNVVNGDGCNSTCTVESGFECAGSPSVCTPTVTCGDGVVEGAEECDDGNVVNGDGCNSTCTVESGFQCTGSPSACVPACLDLGAFCSTGSECCSNNCMASSCVP